MKLLQKLKDLHAKEVEVKFSKRRNDFIFWRSFELEKLGIDFELEKTDEDIFTLWKFWKWKKENIICSVEVGFIFL